MFTKKITDLFTTDLLNAVSGVLGEAKKCGDCGCAKCTCEPEEEDEPEETKEGYVSHAQRKAVWANRADDGKGHPDKKKMKKEGYMPTNDMPSDKDRKVAGKLGAMLKREREAKEKKEPLGVKTEETSGKQHIEVTHITGEKSKKPVHPDNAFKALNHYKSLSTTKSARIVSEEVEEIEEKTGLWDNIHAKRKRIKAGSGERMRKPGSKGAPTAADFKASANEAFEQMHEEKHPIVKEYDSLKKHDIKTLRGMISQQNKVVDTSEFKTKDHAISHYLRNKHGNKKVDTAFGFKEEVEIDESTYDKMMTAKKTWAAYPTASNERAYKAAKELHKKTKTNEEVEELDELSRKTLSSYIKGATHNKDKIGDKIKQIDKARRAIGDVQHHVDDQSSFNDVSSSLRKASSKLTDKEYNRKVGISKALNKLTKEEQEFIDALNADTLDEARGRPKKAGAKDFTIHPKT